jgi:hypothetical protein
VRLQGRVYFKFGQPVDTASLDVKDEAACEATYFDCKRRVEAEIADLLEYRENDPKRGGWARLQQELAGSFEMMTQSRSDAAVRRQ